MPEAHEDGSGPRRPRKERVLHTRVSDNLAEDIRRIADDLRVPASNLVRNVLEEVFEVVESVGDDMGELLANVLEEADAARSRLSQNRAVRAERPGSSGGEQGPPPPPIAWHIVRAGQAVGPLSRDELAAEARAGRFSADTLVWCPGMVAWEAAAVVPGVCELAGPPPVPGAGTGSAADPV